jgi:hypothetical protein
MMCRSESRSTADVLKWLHVVTCYDVSKWPTMTLQHGGWRKALGCGHTLHSDAYFHLIKYSCPKQCHKHIRSEVKMYLVACGVGRSQLVASHHNSRLVTSSDILFEVIWYVPKTSNSQILNALSVNPLQTVGNHLKLESVLGSMPGCSSAGFLQIYHHAPRKTNNFSVMTIHVNRSSSRLDHQLRCNSESV